MHLNQSNSVRGVVPILSRIDLPILLALVILCGIGLGIQFSAGGEDVDQVWRQTIRISIAVLFMVGLTSISLETLRKYTPHLYTGSFLLLVLVLIIGTVGRGAQRWLDLGVISFQPAELMKIAVPMMVAWLLTRSQMFNRKLSFVVCGFLVLFPALLVYMQPDLGTAILIASVGGFAIFLGGLSWRWITSIGVVTLISFPLIWPLLHEYQRQRVITMFDPWKDPLGQGYHSVQSMIAIGSGGVYGKGWLNGSQSQLEFIPERSTDFVFSVFAEEFGLIGSVILVLVFLFLISRCFVIAYRSKSDFGRIVASSIAIMIFVHLFVNIGMVAGILPVVGIPLPIISYGGTSMVTVLAGIGIVMGVRHAKD